MFTDNRFHQSYCTILSPHRKCHWMEFSGYKAHCIPIKILNEIVNKIGLSARLRTIDTQWRNCCHCTISRATTEKRKYEWTKICALLIKASTVVQNLTKKNIWKREKPNVKRICKHTTIANTQWKQFKNGVLKIKPKIDDIKSVCMN